MDPLYGEIAGPSAKDNTDIARLHLSVNHLEPIHIFEKIIGFLLVIALTALIFTHRLRG